MFPARLLTVPAVALAAACLIRCASAARMSEPPPADESARQAAAPSQAADEEAERRRALVARAEREARGFRDDLDCRRQIKSGAGGPDYTWALMNACIKLDKFRDLELFFDAGWKSMRAEMPRDVLIERVAQVMALRGGPTLREIKRLEQESIPLFQPAQALEKPEAFAGAFVIFRGRLSTSGQPEEGRLAVAEVARITKDRKETIYTVEGDRSFSGAQQKNAGELDIGDSSKYGTVVDKREEIVGRNNEYVKTGITVSLDPGGRTVAGPKDKVFLIRFEGGGEKRGRGRLVQSFPAGVDVPELSR